MNPRHTCAQTLDTLTEKLTPSTTFDKLLLSKLSPTRDGLQPPSANSRVSLPVIPHLHPQTLGIVYLLTCVQTGEIQVRQYLLICQHVRLLKAGQQIHIQFYQAGPDCQAGEGW